MRSMMDIKTVISSYYLSFTTVSTIACKEGLMDVSGCNVFLGNYFSFYRQLSLKIALHGVPFDEIPRSTSFTKV